MNISPFISGCIYLVVTDDAFFWFKWIKSLKLMRNRLPQCWNISAFYSLLYTFTELFFLFAHQWMFPWMHHTHSRFFLHSLPHKAFSRFYFLFIFCFLRVQILLDPFVKVWTCLSSSVTDLILFSSLTESSFFVCLVNGKKLLLTQNSLDVFVVICWTP